MNWNSFTALLAQTFGWVWTTSLYASVLIALVFAIQRVFGKRLPARLSYALGLLVLLRLIIPAVPASNFSLFNLKRLFAARSVETRIQPAIRPQSESIPAKAINLSAGVSSLRNTPPTTPNDWLTPGSAVWLGGLVISIFIVWRQQRKFVRWMKSQRALDDERDDGVCPGSAPASGAVVGAIARHTGPHCSVHFDSPNPTGEGAGRNTRGRACSPIPMGSDNLRRLLNECRVIMSVQREVRLVLTPQRTTPALFGWRRPRLLLPEATLEKLDERELRMVILHELAHVKRGDILLNWLIIFVRSLHWFNPLVWPALRRLRADRELVCDAMVMSHLAADERSAYGTTLIKLLDDFSGAGFCPSLAPVISHKHEIKRRVTMIAQFKPVSRIALLLAAATVAALCCFTFTRAAEKKAPALNVGNPKSEASLSETRPLDEMKKRMEELNGRAREAEEKVDLLRRELGIPSSVASGKVEGGVDPETIRKLETTRIDVESTFKGLSELLYQLKELKTQGSDKLRKAILTVNYDPQLGKLLEDLWTTETTLVKLKDSIGPSNPEFKSVSAMRDDLDKKVDQRIEGILAGMEARVSAAKAHADSLAKAVQEARIRDAEGLGKYRSYFQARRDLESLQKVRDALYLKILEQEYGVEAHKSENTKE